MLGEDSVSCAGLPLTTGEEPWDFWRGPSFQRPHGPTQLHPLSSPFSLFIQSMHNTVLRDNLRTTILLAKQLKEN